MAGIDSLLRSSPLWGDVTSLRRPAPALRAGWSNEGFESSLPTPDKAKSPVKRGFLLYLAERQSVIYTIFWNFLDMLGKLIMSTIQHVSALIQFYATKDLQ